MVSTLFSDDPIRGKIYTRLSSRGRAVSGRMAVVPTSYCQRARGPCSVGRISSQALFGAETTAERRCV
jgi:hypothetical protein